MAEPHPTSRLADGQPREHERRHHDREPRRGERDRPAQNTDPRGTPPAALAAVEDEHPREPRERQRDGEGTAMAHRVVQVPTGRARSDHGRGEWRRAVGQRQQPYLARETQREETGERPRQRADPRRMQHRLDELNRRAYRSGDSRDRQTRGRP